VLDVKYVLGEVERRKVLGNTVSALCWNLSTG
jgi:hypothetical protein